MSATDDISGPWGPLGTLELFGQCKHGMVTREPSAYLAPVVYTLHLPNGTTEPYKGPELLYQDGPDGFSYSYGYGQGGSNYYWKRPGIGPVSRTPEQLAADALLGHEWRNDRANADWFWCDDAGDRWRVSVAQSGGSGLSKNYTLTLKQAGLIGKPGVTRSTTVTVTDPGDKALPADFHERADSAFKIALQDINSDGSRAAFGIMRKPSTATGNTFQLFTMSREQADMFAIPLAAGPSWVQLHEPTLPPYVATSYFEFVLSGSVLADAWSASATTALNRAQTAGTYTYSAEPAHQKVAVWDSYWPITLIEPWPGDPSAQRITYSGTAHVVTLGEWEFPYESDAQATIKTLEGAGEYTITGRDMVVGVMYKTSGALAVISSDIDYSYAYHSTATGAQAGSRVSKHPGDIVVSDTRTRTNARSSGKQETASYRIKVDGMQVFDDNFEASYEYSYSVEIAYGPDYMGIPQQTVTSRTSSGLETARAGDSTLSQPFDYTAEGVSPIYPLPWASSPSGAREPDFYVDNATDLASWRLRTGLKKTRGASPSPPSNSMDTRPGGPRLAWWDAHLPRASNACFQYRRGATRANPFVPWVGWAVVGPVVTSSGATVGQYSGNPASPNFDPLPPMHCARNPFTGAVVQSVYRVNFV